MDFENFKKKSANQKTRDLATIEAAITATLAIALW